MKIHFIGIGGIGVSALSQYYLERGHRVSGSDLAFSEITDFLKQKGAKIFLGPHNSKNISKDTGLIIYSPAITPENPELKEAKKLKIKCQSYPEALGDLTRSHYTIAITGTHGKSTTTCMLGLLLEKAGLDPTVIVGTKLKEFGNSNYRGGESKYLVIEACEHFESFLHYWPKIIILTNIESDHLDYYKNLNNVLRGFKKFISHLPKNGVLVANKDGANVKKILKKGIKAKILYYSLEQKEAPKIKEALKVPGDHNVSNALSAFAVAKILGVPDKISFKALSEFSGSWRRFEEKELKIKNSKLKIISDYAHHPTEIRATLGAAREKYPRKIIWCVFQPHQYQRTFYLFKDFIKVFTEAIKSNWVDKLILIDIYDVVGREEMKIKKKVSSEKMAGAIKDGLKKSFAEDVLYVSDVREAKKYLKKNISGGEIIVVMGAGDIYKLTPQQNRGSLRDCASRALQRNV